MVGYLRSWYVTPPSTRARVMLAAAICATYLAIAPILVRTAPFALVDLAALPVAALGGLFGTVAGLIAAPTLLGLLVAVSTATGSAIDPNAADAILIFAMGFSSGQLRDLLDRSRAQTAEIARSRGVLLSVVRSLPMTLWHVDADGRFTLREGTGLYLLKQRPGEHVGEDAREFWRAHYPESPELGPYLDRAVAGDDFTTTLHLRGRALDVRYIPTRDGSGVSTGVLCVANDVTGRHEAEAASRRSEAQRRGLDDRLAHLTLHDPLTELPNRTLFRQRIDGALETAHSDGSTFAVLLLDLDTFTETNDALGQDAGDEILREVATRLSTHVRGVDTVARVGGDEFGLVLNGADAAGGGEVAERILTDLQRPFVAKGRSVHVGASIGIVVAPINGDGHEALIRRSHAAMYQARRTHLRYRVYDPDESDEPTADQVTLASDLLDAIERGEIDVAFQPEVAVKDGALVRVEALARWTHPEHGAIPPQRFVALAEHLGVIGALTRTTLDRTLAQAACWRAEGRSVAVGVNVSATDLSDPGFPSLVAATLERHGVPPSDLILELTESSLVADLDRARSQLQGLRDLGVAVAIDDFGTGYSSLSYLAGLPVSEIKIDRSFVRFLAERASGLAIVRSAVALAHDLGLTVVAEGVETPRQMRLLRSLRCDVAQGFLIGRPVSAAELTRWLDDRATQEPTEAA